MSKRASPKGPSSNSVSRSAGLSSHRWDSTPRPTLLHRVHALQELERAGLGQRFVEVAALGRLDARRAAGAARALADEPARVPAQLFEAREALTGDPHPARVSV